MPVVALCSSCHCTFLLVCHAVDSWEPGCRDHPTIMHDTLTTRFLLHRYLHELPEPICCRGIIFGFVAVAPFPFHRRGTLFPAAMATNASYLAHVNIFIKFLKTCI